HEDDEGQGKSELPCVIAPVALEVQIDVEAGEGSGARDPRARARFGPGRSHAPALDGQAVVHPGRAAQRVKENLVGPREHGPDRGPPAVPVAWEVAKVEWIGELHPETPRIGDDAPSVHEKPGWIERLPPAEVLGLERRHPEAALGHGAIHRPLSPGGIGEPRIAPARDYVDVRVQRLLDVTELGDILEE